MSDKNGKVPPQDLTAEKSLLGAIMLAEDVMADVLTIVRPRDFYDKRHEIIFEAMINLYDRHKPIDLLTLTSELKTLKKLKDVGGAAYLTELSTFVPVATHAKAYAEIVEKMSVRRRLVKAGSNIAEKAYEDDVDTDALVGEAERELFEVSDKIIKSDYVAMDELLADALENCRTPQKPRHLAWS